MSPSARLARAVQRHGVGGVARRGADRVVTPLRPGDAQQIWYRLDVADPARPRRELAPEFVLRRGTRQDADRLGALPADDSVNKPTPELIDARLRGGATLWVVDDGDRAAFACWTFAGAAPVWGAKGELVLPGDTALLEDSLASPHVRGRGVAPGAWTAVADNLRDDGYAAMMTKVDARNTPSRRAVEKAGFRPVGVMSVRSRLGLRRIRVRAEPEVRFLAALERG
jgi:RimJ/RimL family protein N-acetyltransferase